MTGENQTVKLQITSPYRIQKEYLKKNIRKGEFSLPYKKEAKEELIQAVNAASFLGGKEAKDAKIIYKDKKFQIIPEKVEQWLILFVSVKSSLKHSMRGICKQRMI